MTDISTAACERLALIWERSSWAGGGVTHTSAAALIRALRAQLDTARADAFREAADAFPMELNDKRGEAVRKAFRNRILALADQPAASGWRDIATAPRDTTPVLCYSPGSPEAGRAPHCRTDHQHEPTRYWRMWPDAPYTHWQHLPAAPEAPANAE